MTDEVVRAVVSLSVEGLASVAQASKALDEFASVSERSARRQAASLEGLANAANQAAIAQERLRQVQRAQVTGASTARSTDPGLSRLESRIEEDRARVAANAAAQQAAAARTQQAAATSQAQTVRQVLANAQAAHQASLLQQQTVARNIANAQQQAQAYRAQAQAVQQQRAFINQLGGGGAGITGPGGTGIPPGGFGPQGPQGYGGGFYNRASGYGQQFQTGFRGLRDRPYAEQLGQTFKFATFYGAAYGILFQLGNAFANAADEAVKFQDAINSLNIVTGKSTDQNRDLADSLGEIAAKAGVSPSEGVGAGARAIGLFGLTEAPVAQQDAAARTATRVATQIALGSGRTFEQIQNDLGAIAQAYGTGYQGQSRIADLDAFITKRYGRTVGDSLETTAQIGTIAQEQGFSLAEQTTIATALQSRTGQSPAAVAGFLSQIYGKGTDPRLQTELQGLGVGPGTLREQFDQLSQLDLTADQLNAVADKISKGKAGSAFRALIQDFQRIEALAAEAEASSAGSSEAQFQQRLQNTAGQLREFAGAVAEFGKDILSTGILDLFGGLVIAFRTVLQSLDPLVDLFNQMPPALRYTALGITAVLAATKFAGGQNAVIGRFAAAGPNNLLANAAAQGAAVASNAQTRALQFIPYSASVSGAVQTGNVINRTRGGFAPGLPIFQGSAQPITGIANAQAQSALGGKTAAQLARAGVAAEALATLTNPITIAIVGLVAIGAIKGKVDELNIALKDAIPAIEAIGSARSPEEFRNAANAATNAAIAVSNGRSGIDGFLGGALVPGSASREKTLFAQGTFGNAAADALAQEKARAAALRDVSIFGDPATRTIESITEALKALEGSGVSAQRRLELLYQALNPDQGGEREFRVPKASVAVGLAQGVGNDAALLAALSASQTGDAINNGYGTARFGRTTGAAAEASEAAVQARVDLIKQQQTAILEAAQKALPDTAKGGVLDETQIQAVGDAVIAALGVDITSIAGASDAVRAYIKTYLEGRVVTGSSPAERLNPQELFEQYSQNLKPSLDAALGSIEGLGDPSKAIPIYAKFIKEAEALIAQTNYSKADDIGTVQNDLQAVRVKYAQAVVAELENDRKAAQARATSKKQIKAIGQAALNAEVAALAVAGDVSGLRDIMENANRGMVRIAIRELRGGIAIARVAARSARVRLAAAVATINSNYAAYEAAAAADAAAQEGLKAAEAAVAAAEKALKTGDVPAKGGGYGTGGDTSNPIADAPSGPSDTKAQIAAARAQAYATRRGGGIAEATAGLRSAKADMDAAKKGTVEFYSALGAYFAAQNSLRDALRDYQTNQQLLGGDISDPIFQAQVRLDAARKKLRQDRARGAGRDVIAQDRLDVRQAQLDAESVKFNERLQAAQTAERLGRISHAAYIRYLENESKRLNAIKNRTYQQQQQLDQVDLALKDAKEAFAGQFNIGDIKLPTPYEVRRYIKAQADGLTYQGGQAVSAPQTTIQIDGTDVGMVIRVLSEYLGPAAAGRTGTNASKKG